MDNGMMHTLNLGVNVDALPQPTSSDVPPKRRPGRPKGSTKKNLLGQSDSPLAKVKRPVGRPRKDGMPAGSVAPTRPKREKQSVAPYLVPQPDNGLRAVPYPPPMAMYQPPVQYMPQPIIQIDPSLSGDEWAAMSRNDPNGFLSVLLASLAAPNPMSTAGPSVEDAFKSHLSSLTPTHQHIPTLYSILKTFWLPSSPAYFSLTASASTARTPSEHRFLYWDPMPLVFNGIACPSCAQPLVNKGRISTGPIKIYDIEKPFFIIGSEYLCKSPACLTHSIEGRRFASTDSSIIRSLPAKLKDEFPARLLHDGEDAGCGPNVWNWKDLGVSWSLWNMVIGALRMGLKKEVIIHLIHSIQHGVPDGGVGKPEETLNGNVVHNSPQLAEASSSRSAPEDIGQSSQPPPSFSEQYNEAWKENATIVPDPVNSPPPALVASTSQQTPVSTSATMTSPAPQTAFYQPYPFAPYGYITPAHPLQFTSGPPHDLPPPPPQQPEPTVTVSTSKRSPRHCCKCGSQDCKGKGGRNFCLNACQDCGKLDCKGRNSRRPDKKCSEGWS